jgi:hypothetical protein
VPADSSTLSLATWWKWLLDRVEIRKCRNYRAEEASTCLVSRCFIASDSAMIKGHESKAR